MLTRDDQTPISTSPETKCPYFVRIFLCLLLCTVPQLVCGPIVSSQAGNLTDFRSGGSVTEQLSARAEREFQVFLQTGELLKFSVVKGDLNVSVELRDPGGQQVVEYRSYSYEPIELSAVAESSGVFLLEIRSLETATRLQQFALTVDPVRRATGDDAKNAAAEIAIATATWFCAEWTEPSFRKAIDKYAEASALARDSHVASTALRKAGETYFLLGEYKQALDCFQRASALSQRAGKHHDALEAATEAARLHSLLGNNDKAQSELNRVLSFYSDRNTQNETAVIKHGYAWALSHQGEILYSKGDSLGSLDSFERALELFQETADRNGQARALIFMGHSSNMLGQLEQAMAHFSRAYDLYHELGNKSGEALAITAKGITYSRQGKDEEGIKLHREAMTIFQMIGDHPSEAITLNAIGQAYQDLNKNELALDHYKQALRLFKESGTIDFIPAPLHQIASIYSGMNNVETALAYFEECARVSRASKKHRTEAYALNEIASIYARQGRHGEALSLYFKILRSHVSRGDPLGQALTLNNIGDLHLAAGRKLEALAGFKRALPLSEKAGDRGVEIATLFNIARAARDCGMFDEAKSYIERSIHTIETLRTNVASPDDRLSYFSALRKHYDLYIALLMQAEMQRPGQGFVEEALIASERSRARAFVELLAEAGANIRQGVDPAVLKREKELQSLLAAYARYQMEVTGSAESNQVKVNERLDRLKAEYEELQTKVRNESPQYQMLTRPRALTIKEIQSQLRPDDLLLEYSLGEERSYLWAVTSNSLKGYEIKPRSMIDAASLEVYKLLTARQMTGPVIDDKYQSRVEEADKQYYNKALALSRMLLGPVAGVLKNKRLLIVTEGLSQFISFDALPRPETNPDNVSLQDSFLISDHQIVILPSVSALAAIRAEGNRLAPSRRAVAVFADPVFSSNDDRVQTGKTSTDLAATFRGFNPLALRGFDGLTERGGLRRLIYSSEEADSILAAASGAAWVVKGFEASRENVMADKIGQYQVVHFATHGLVNTEHPELSGIVLSMIKPDGTSVDGFLQLHDVFNLKLSAELTVLSACDTGLGKDVRGEGLIGLTRGLMFAGSRSVVASLWKVDDRATAVLMGHFYKAMLQDGLPRAAALRYAKEQLRKDPAWSAPFFWAGFVLQGEYDKPITVEQKPRVFPKIVVLVLLAVIAGSLLILRSIYRGHRMNTVNRS
jgi:CHAT domain-containing protein/tetratricopeptide (TPR) repeat protein